jgi:hypothetical protein
VGARRSIRERFEWQSGLITLHLGPRRVPALTVRNGKEPGP